jgi:CCR4-NOT transcription complex subunit 10
MAFQKIQQNYSNPDNLSLFLKSRKVKKPLKTELMQTIACIPIRRTIYDALVIHSAESPAALRALLDTFDVTPDIHHRPVLPLQQTLLLAQAALFIDDRKKFRDLLEAADDSSHFAIVNNKGLCELLQNRSASALLHFSQALAASHFQSVIYPLHKVVYNTALALLFQGSPKKAFLGFHSIIPLMPKSAFLWLRLAECCVSYYKQRIAAPGTPSNCPRAPPRTRRTRRAS